MRIASLLPAATELICAIGAADLLVARSHECDFPDGVENLPAVTRTRIDAGADSRSIHDEVEAAVERGLSIFEVDFDTLATLKPDLILTQDLCAVCAVDQDQLQARVADVLGAEVDIENLAPTRLADVWAQIRRLGERTGRSAHASDLMKRSFSRLARVADRIAGQPRPGLLAIEWLDPVMLGGLWMPDLIRLAGAQPLAAVAGEPAPTMDADALTALQPEVVLIKPCGFRLEQTLKEADLIRRTLPSHWPAVKNDRVWLADGNAYFNRPGPRLVDGVEMLAAIAHPEQSDGDAWIEEGSLKALALQQ